MYVSPSGKTIFIYFLIMLTIYSEKNAIRKFMISWKSFAISYALPSEGLCMNSIRTTDMLGDGHGVPLL
jgi:tricorn protease-like protein